MFPPVEKPATRFVALLRGDHPLFPSAKVREVGIEYVRGEWHVWCTTGGFSDGKITGRFVDDPPFYGFSARLKEWGFAPENAERVARELCVKVDQQLLDAGLPLQRPEGVALH